jgi:hypothetical protein
MKTFLLNCREDLAEPTECFGSCLNFHWNDSDYSLLWRLLKRLGLESCKLLLNSKLLHRNTPLYNAAAEGAYLCVELMLKHGADPNIIGGELGTPLNGSCP